MNPRIHTLVPGSRFGTTITYQRGVELIVVITSTIGARTPQRVWASWRTSLVQTLRMEIMMARMNIHAPRPVSSSRLQSPHTSAAPRRVVQTVLALTLLAPIGCASDDFGAGSEDGDSESESGDDLELVELVEPELAEPEFDEDDPDFDEDDLDWESPSQEIPVLTNTELSQLLLNGTYNITNAYNPVANGHAGIDFGGVGDGVTTVYSPITGTVTANTTACGKVAIYDGVNTVILAHMSNISAPPVGSQISIGTAVGKASKVVGGGCVANGAHLHIEIRTGNNTSMANPAVNNVNTTRNPATYTYSPFKAVSLLSPGAGASVNVNPVNFSWAAQPGANTYRLQISATNAFNAETCTNGCVYNVANSTTARAVALNPGTYYWRVRAGNSGQGGLWSTVRTVTKL